MSGPGRPNEGCIRDSFKKFMREWFPGFMLGSKKGKRLYLAYRHGWSDSKKEKKNEQSDDNEW